MVMAAEAMLSTPYQAGLLDKGSEEELTVELTKSDCILLVESCLAMVLNSTSPFPSYDQMEFYIQNLRYRKGIVDDYASRIHYTSEWIAQGEKLGYIREITKSLSGEPLDQEFSFMSSNPHLYKQLTQNPEQVAKIRTIEEQLESSQPYYYIPKERIQDITSELISGDIIAFTTNVKGLDISHLGIVYKIGERCTFIHASSKAGEVIIHPTDLVEYTSTLKRVNGIRVVRL